MRDKRHLYDAKSEMSPKLQLFCVQITLMFIN